MKRAQAVTITLVGQVATAVLLTGCDEQQRAIGPVEYQRCVDEWGRVVQDRYCADAYARGRSGFVHNGYYWHYGGSGYYPGETVTGGSSRPSSGLTAVKPNAPGAPLVAPTTTSTPRGGFGTSAPSSSVSSGSSAPRGGFGGSFSGGGGGAGG